VRSASEIRRILKRLDGEPADALEDEDLEFKPWDPDQRALARTVREHVVCLANHRGGTLVLGVRDGVRTRQEAIQGVGDYDRAALRRSIYDGTDPHILVELEEIVEDGRRLLLVHVPRGMPPHTTSEGLAKIRVGKDCVPLTGQMLARLLAMGGQRDPTAEIIPGASDADLDQTELERLRRMIRRQQAEPSDLARLAGPALLEALRLRTDEGLTMGAILLAGTTESLRRYVPQHEVIFIRYRSATRYDIRKDFQRPLLAVLDEVEQLLATLMRIRTLQEEGFGQLELPDLSWEVGREAVLNALTHRDYFLRQGIHIGLHADRLEVTSPGGFVGGITPDNVLRHPPVHRNELLARAFQAIGLVNRVGLGVDRIYEGLLRLGKGVPRYEADEAHVRLTLPLATDERFALFVAREERDGRQLSLDDLLVLRALTGVATLDRWFAARVLQLPEHEAAERLASLRERGYLVVRGRGRAASYSLRRDLAERFRGTLAAAMEVPLDEAHVRLRVMQLLRERRTLTNAEIRRISGFSRTQVYRLVRRMAEEGDIRIVGKGRGAHVELATQEGANAP
jgi:ATP-dependent DNA helicase RecG